MYILFNLPFLIMSLNHYHSFSCCPYSPGSLAVSLPLSRLLVHLSVSILFHLVVEYMLKYQIMFGHGGNALWISLLIPFCMGELFHWLHWHRYCGGKGIKGIQPSVFFYFSPLRFIATPSSPPLLAPHHRHICHERLQFPVRAASSSSGLSPRLFFHPNKVSNLSSNISVSAAGGEDFPFPPLADPCAAFAMRGLRAFFAAGAGVTRGGLACFMGATDDRVAVGASRAKGNSESLRAAILLFLTGGRFEFCLSSFFVFAIFFPSTPTLLLPLIHVYINIFVNNQQTLIIIVVRGDLH